MTVAELIAELRQYPRGHEVWLMAGDTATGVDHLSLDSHSKTVDITGEDA